MVYENTAPLFANGQLSNMWINTCSQFLLAYSRQETSNFFFLAHILREKWEKVSQLTLVLESKIPIQYAHTVLTSESQSRQHPTLKELLFSHCFKWKCGLLVFLHFKWNFTEFSDAYYKPEFFRDTALSGLPGNCLQESQGSVLPWDWPWLRQGKSQGNCMTRHTKHGSRLTYPSISKVASPKTDTEALPITATMLEWHDAFQQRSSTC